MIVYTQAKIIFCKNTY